jgi:hypothetical protein
MTNRLNQLSWGWITIGFAYGVAALPIQSPHRLFWVGLVVAAAYLVLAIRTTHDTAVLARASDNQSIFALWHTAFSKTLMHRGLLLIPMFSLMMAAHQFLVVVSPQCSTLLQAYCSLNVGIIQVETLIISASLLGIFLLLDHALLIALSLLSHKHLAKSSTFVGNIAVGLRFAIACAILSVTAVNLSFVEVAGSAYGYANTQTDRRILETIYPSFEPIVTTGFLLSANTLTHPSYCSYTPQPCYQFFDTRPFIARQLFIAALSALMYGLLIAGILRLSRPNTYKAKRGLAEDVYL